MKRIISRAILNSMFALLCFDLALGCMTHDRAPASVEQSPAYDMPPAKMFDAVRKIVSSPPIWLAVQEQRPGTLITGWQPFRGEFHIARYWYERTRYHISIVPDFNDPAHRSHIQITDETQERAEESGFNPSAERWTAAPDLHRPQRSAALLQQIENQLANYPR